MFKQLSDRRFGAVLTSKIKGETLPLEEFVVAV